MARGVPADWGEPVTDTLDGELAKALFVIPAVKGVEFGAVLRPRDSAARKTMTPLLLKMVG